jgi:diguanylate cyclase (GGDEF)-like protein/PAS domain S-box-containing protein
MHFAEMLSVQMSLAARTEDIAAMQSILWAAVKRNDELVSAAVRRNDNKLLVQFGEHDSEWASKGRQDTNSATHMSLPIMQRQASLGRIELVFEPLGAGGWRSLFQGGINGLIFFILLVGTLGYWFLLRRSLQYLDPNAVVPDRVRSALDVLSNGVLIVDEKERIVLVNEVFKKKMRFTEDELIGKKPSRLDWVFHSAKGQPRLLPWVESLRTSQPVTGVLLSYTPHNQPRCVFIVNSAPVFDENNKLKGAMIGFEDVTEIEQKNKRLKSMLNELEASKKEVEQQNKKLHVLATRDPLTDCFNRRAFNEMFAEALAEAKLTGQPVACVMTDIDHFKRVNDTYGHAAGDEIIKLAANAIRDNLREGDVIGRYGGEEFCIILPGLSTLQAHRIAERCRLLIEAQEYDGIKITNSFGIASTEAGCFDPELLVQRADEALYSSKEGGRNRVTVWADTNHRAGDSLASLNRISS